MKWGLEVKNLLCLFVFLSLLPHSYLRGVEPTVREIASLAAIPENQSDHTLYFFDVDDTLLDFPHMVGSRAWRRYIVSATEYDSRCNWHDVLSLFLNINYPVVGVEKITAEYIQELQEKGHSVFGLTTRERNIWYTTPVEEIDILTIQQLESIGVSLNAKSLNPSLSYLIQAPEYYEGVFFCDIDSKGEYLTRLLKGAGNLPPHVIFVDDKKAHVEAVALALSELGIEHECYWYTATNKKFNRFNPWIANIQLYFHWMFEAVLSDEQAAQIAKDEPERDENYYLKSVMLWMDWNTFETKEFIEQQCKM